MTRNEFLAADPLLQFEHIDDEDIKLNIRDDSEEE